MIFDQLSPTISLDIEEEWNLEASFVRTRQVVGRCEDFIFYFISNLGRADHDFLKREEAIYTRMIGWRMRDKDDRWLFIQTYVLSVKKLVILFTNWEGLGDTIHQKEGILMNIHSTKSILSNT